MLFVCFLIFALEVVVNSVVVDGYKFSFFFWLEIIAAIAIIPDIEWMVNPIEGLFGISQSRYQADADGKSTGSDNSTSNLAYNALSSFKFFKLLRVVRLYRYCISAVTSEDDAEGSSQHSTETPQQAAMKKELDPNALGRMLSETTTRKILIAVLLMYIAYPILTYTESQNTFYNGLKQLFISASTNCTEAKNPYCATNLITEAGWVVLLNDFVALGKTPGSDTTYYDLLWFRTANLLSAGKIEDIPYVYNTAATGYAWKQNDGCSGMKVSDRDDCEFRTEEMKVIGYQPVECTNGVIPGCGDLVVYARLSVREKLKKEALYKFFMIVFTTLLLFFLAISIGNDTKQIVVRPMAKVIGVVKRTTDCPLRRHDPPVVRSADEDDDQESASTLKTRVLEQVLYRISRLLQMCYGKLGAQILREGKMLSAEGEVNSMVPGSKIEAAFLVCRISKFAEITDALQEETTVFVNKFAKIVHDCAAYWGGSANKNAGDSFLITWKLPSQAEEESNKQRGEESRETRDLGINALTAAIKIYAEILRAGDLKAYSRHPRIKSKYIVFVR